MHTVSIFHHLLEACVSPYHYQRLDSMVVWSEETSLEDSTLHWATCDPYWTMWASAGHVNVSMTTRKMSRGP